MRTEVFEAAEVGHGADEVRVAAEVEDLDALEVAYGGRDGAGEALGGELEVGDPAAVAAGAAAGDPLPPAEGGAADAGPEGERVADVEQGRAVLLAAQAQARAGAGRRASAPCEILLGGASVPPGRQTASAQRGGDGAVNAWNVRRKGSAETARCRCRTRSSRAGCCP